MDLENGTYKARAVEAKLGKTSTKKDQVGVLFEVTDGPRKGERITWYGFFTDKTMERTAEALSYCGCDDVTNLSTVTRHEVMIVVEAEADLDGAMRPRVRWVNRLGSGGVSMKTALSESEAASLQERIRARKLAKASSESTEDEIPF